jgi:hypothetical protein
VLRTDAGPPAADFPVNMSRCPDPSNLSLFCERLFDIIPDDDGDFADPPHIDFALIEQAGQQAGLCVSLQEHDDLLARMCFDICSAGTGFFRTYS